MELVVEETGPRGGPKLKWMDRTYVDLKEISVQVVGTQDRVSWKNIGMIDLKSM